MKKLFALLLALMMVLALAACGGEDPAESSNDADPADSSVSTTDPSADNDPAASDPAASGTEADNGEVTGGTDGFGDFASILVPEGFTFEWGNWLDENDPHFVSVKRSDWTYFDFHNYTDEASMLSNYDSFKDTYTNEQTDVSANYNGIDWIGFQYSDGFVVYTNIGANYMTVSAAGMTFDDAIAQAVLGSVVMAQ